MKKLIALLLLIPSVSFASGWQCVNRQLTCNTWRWAVPHGWLVSTDNGADGHGIAMVFYSDENHEWKGE